MTKHFLSVCAVIKNEAPYIEEWIELHLLQGVEHFYLYDNGSTDGTLGILIKYKELGLVSVNSWGSVNPIQFKAYNDCLNKHSGESELIAFLDGDEFLHATAGRTLRSELLELFKTGVAAVAVKWVLFGTNGHERKTEALVLERFTKRQAGVNPHCKSVVRSALTRCVGLNPHYFRIKRNCRAIDENGVQLPPIYGYLEGGSAEILRVAHFHTKSLEEYFKRKQLPDPGTGRIDAVERVRERALAHDRNEIEDTYLRDAFAERIKENIRNRPWNSLV